MKRYLVYADATKNRQFVKIGQCYGNLYLRRTTRNTDCPFEMELLGVIQYPSKQEMREAEIGIHKRFAQYNAKGEWFLWNAEIQAYIHECFDKRLGERVLKQDFQSRLEQGREYKRKRYQNDPEYRERRREREREYRQRPEVKERHRQYSRKWHAENPNYQRERRARKKRDALQINEQLILFDLSD